MEMEMELGLKIMQTREDMASFTLFKKDRSNHPPFKYTETDTMFILTAYLSGFKKNQLKVEIDRTGTKIAISGEKWVQEMAMVRWQMQKKDPQIRRFRRVFQIPEGIVVDRIKAKFDELDSLLTIFMPKSKIGIQGIQIKDISHEEEKQEVIGTSATTEPMEDSAKQGIPKLPDGGLVRDSQILEECEMGRRGEVEQIDRWEVTFEKEHELKEMSGVEVPPHGKLPIMPEGIPHDQMEEPVIPDSTEAGIADEKKAAVSTKKSEESPEAFPAESKVREDNGAATEADTEVLPLESAEEKEKRPQQVEKYEAKAHDHRVGAEPSKPSSEMLPSPEAEPTAKQTMDVASHGKPGDEKAVREIEEAEQTMDVTSHGKPGDKKAVTEIEEAEGDEGKTGVQEADASKEDRDTGPVEKDTGEALQRTTDGEGSSSRRSRSRFCRPRYLIAGSTIIFSLVVAVLHLLKTRRNRRAIREKGEIDGKPS